MVDSVAEWFVEHESGSSEVEPRPARRALGAVLTGRVRLCLAASLTERRLKLLKPIGTRRADRPGTPLGDGLTADDAVCREDKVQNRVDQTNGCAERKGETRLARRGSRKRGTETDFNNC